MQDLTVAELERHAARTAERVEYYSKLAEEKRILAQDPNLTGQAAGKLLSKASDIDEGVRGYQDDLEEYMAEINSRTPYRFGTRLYMYFYHGGNNNNERRRYSHTEIKDVYFRNYAQLQGAVSKFIGEKVDRRGVRHARIECLVRHYERLDGNHIDWILDEASYARLRADPDLRVVISVTYP